MRSALVTGGAGFIGSHLVDALIEGGVRVRVLDDFSTGREENLAHLADRVDVVRGSVVDPAACEEACAGVDVVFHQAAVPSVSRSVERPLTTHGVNATGSLNMLRAAVGAGVGRLVYAGSSSAYGDTPTLPKREAMKPKPRSPYAVAKLAGEHYAEAFHAVHGLETVTLRYFNVFGPRQDPSSQYSAAIPIFITRALRGEAPEIFGDGEQTRDFTFVENVVLANLRAAEAPAEAVAGEVFNVGAGERTSVNRLWAEIRGLAGTDAEASHVAPRPGEVRDSLASLDRIREAMGYEVQVDLREGLRRTVEWFRARTGS